MTLHDFDNIRPFEPEELPEAFASLLSDEEFLQIAEQFFPNVRTEAFRQQLVGCTTNLDVQIGFFLPLLTNLVKKCTTAFGFDSAAIPDKAQPYTFISNHRDIVLDSAFLSILLIANGFPTTVEIAIGDNLLIRPWIRTLVRINKSFIVQRSASIREKLASSKQLSEYMHYAIAEKRENIWIAQREGRAKDSDDRTQEALLKMMAMGGEGTPLERIKSLNLVPLSISYEYDPCDFLKAKEFQQKRDIEGFKKSKQDDLDNMRTGIFGYKGRVHYCAAAPVNTWIDSLADLPKAEFFKALAEGIDRAIHAGYLITPGNCVAADELAGEERRAGNGYTPEQKAAFDKYIDERLALIDLPNKDEAFLRRMMLEMYANPLKNYEAARR